LRHLLHFIRKVVTRLELCDRHRFGARVPHVDLALDVGTLSARVHGLVVDGQAVARRAATRTAVRAAGRRRAATATDRSGTRGASAARSAARARTTGTGSAR